MMEAKFRTDKLQNGNCDTADNFVSPNTADFKTQTSHNVRLKNTATPQAEILFTATPHEKMSNTATPQIPNVPLAEQIGLKWEDLTIDPKLVNTADRNTKQ